MGTGCGLDGYSGWVYRGSTTQPSREEAPEEQDGRGSLLHRPAGVGAGGNACYGDGGGDGYVPPCGPGPAHPWALPVHTLRMPPLGQ